ncbi:MAG: FtsX-like permease family protein [Vicinamibacterales bacterium]
MLSGVTLLVLIIACANVANLSLARTTARERELAVRAALGAGRSRLLRQLLTESLLLALCGGMIGIGLAWVSLDLLVQFVGRFTARTSQIEIDATVLAYSVAAAVLSGLVFGIVPALAARRNLVSSMRLGGSQAGETPQRQYTRSALVVAQVAVSSVLLVGAGLLLESAWRLAAEPLGYDGDRVLTAALTTSDTATSPPVAVINASMAKYWEGADPVGSIFQIPGGNGQPLDVTVAGVVPDFRLYCADQELQIPAQFYLPSSQTGGFAGRVMIRTAGDPMTFVPALKEAVHGVNAGVPVEEVQTLADLRDERQASPRLTTALLSIFAMTALTITLVGLAGVIATSVSHRTREFGLRLALGASPRSVVAMVVRQGAWMVGLGLLAGIAGAIGLSQVLSAYLYETQPTDPSAYLAVVAVFLVAGALACLGPARRATGIDPLASLRSE